MEPGVPGGAGCPWWSLEPLHRGEMEEGGGWSVVQAKGQSQGPRRRPWSRPWRRRRSRSREQKRRSRSRGWSRA